MKILRTLLIGTALISSSVASGVSGDDDLTDVRMPPCLVRMSEVQTIINTIGTAPDIYNEYSVGDTRDYIDVMANCENRMCSLISERNSLKYKIKSKEDHITCEMRALHGLKSEIDTSDDCLIKRTNKVVYANYYREIMALISEVEAYKQLLKSLDVRIKTLDRAQVSYERLGEEIDALTEECREKSSRNDAQIAALMTRPQEYEDAARVTADVHASCKVETDHERCAGGGVVERPIPPSAVGHEAVYRRFVQGRLVYRGPAGERTFPFMDFANPLEGEFNLSGLTFEETWDNYKIKSVDQVLRIKLGYRTSKENDGKVTCWIVPKFAIDQAGGNCAFKRDYQNNPLAWSSDIGIFWSYGNSDLKYFDCLTTKKFDETSVQNLNDLYRESSVLGLRVWGWGWYVAGDMRRVFPLFLIDF